MTDDEVSVTAAPPIGIIVAVGGKSTLAAAIAKMFGGRAHLVDANEHTIWIDEYVEIEPAPPPPIVIKHKHRAKSSPVYALREIPRTHPRSPRESLRRQR